MQASAVRRVTPSAETSSGVSELIVNECEQDMPGVLIPRPESHLVVRFGPTARGGLDAHAFGVREQVHRKLVRRGQRTVTARLQLGAGQAVFGVPASAIAGRVVLLEELWGGAATRRLFDQLAGARDVVGAAAVLERAIAERLALAARRSARAQLAFDAAARLTSAHVRAVATELRVSERHLRRAFRETFGISPKAFAQLARFQRALHAARTGGHPSWANIATATGYYDQAHLIAEFRAIAGVTPRTFLGELRASPLLL
jgi:AraC-like DNA-binding protein